MSTQYDTINLRHRADFRIKIASNLYWVPVNILGRSRFTNFELRKLTLCKSASEIQSLELNVYEAIQLFQCVNPFLEENDIIYYEYDGKIWQLNKSGRYAVESGKGCCSAAATWLNYIVQKKYQSRGYIFITRPNASGHIMNYIYENKKYYIIDMTTQIRSNACAVPVETGNFSDYCAAAIYTGICYEAESLSDFVKYHNRLNLAADYKMSYFSLEATEAIPASCVEQKDGEMRLFTSGEYRSILYSNIHYVRVKDFYIPDKYVEYTEKYK